MLRSRFFYVGLVAILSVCNAFDSPLAVGADHRDSPLNINSGASANGSRDINDVYVFQSPQTATNVVMIITVNPFAGSPRFGTGTTFDSRTIYEFNIDNSSPLDAIPDITFRCYFSAARGGQQRFIVVPTSGRPISGLTGRTTSIPGGGFVTAGLFDDPFFFDSAGFNRGDFSFTGLDNFAAANISAIVLEVPRTALGPNNNISVAARTVDRTGQFDRVGRPAINTVLIPSGKKDAFNQATPDQDQQLFRGDVIATITGLGNGANAATLADFLLPDVLTIDTSSSNGFPNGRRLQDDVIDFELNLLSNGAVVTDLVDANDKTFRTVFPYLAAPHTLSTPSN